MLKLKLHRLWFISLMVVTALGLILGNPHWSAFNTPVALEQPAIAQVPSPPTPETLPEPPPLPSPDASPSPQASPSPEAPSAPTPLASPSPLPPPPAPPSPEPTPAIQEPTASPLEVGGTYEDPNGFYQIAIVQDYKVSSTGNDPLFESPDGQMAYTVVRLPRLTKQRLTNGILAQIAVEELQGGEGFLAQSYIPLGEGVVQVPWTGSLTQGRNSQPMSGTLISTQQEQDVYLVLIAATETGAEQVPNLLASLVDGLEVTPQ
ncbi:hypothetical protein [Roseofilum sp. Guam]|uniref:hypothetical protein n=1 Tax=Roseofilum sp. Guam TaxID=2821502 RepID=UPI001B0B1D65|nr:hypothetical protein [Roseofilum sp. Guam]MBP0029453.1 hypothetical protein [Roseofilum sp. Guam]